MDLKNSTILVTGGSSGIGLEFVRQLTREGAQVIITGRNADLLNGMKQQFPEIHTYQSDVANPEEIRQLYKNVTLQFPQLNMIINNAGEMRLIDMQDGTDNLENITREIDINLSGTIRMAQQFLPHLLTKESAAIVNVSSAIAFMPYSTAPVYSASKAGAHAFTLALRLQLSKSHVKVFEVIPPGVKTSLQSDWIMQPNPKQMMDVDKMVAVAIKGLRNNTAEIRPFLVSLIKLLSRVIPSALMSLGHRDFQKFRLLKERQVKDRRTLIG